MAEPTTTTDLTFADDYAPLLRDVIQATMEEGAAQGYDGNWRRHNIAYHLEHIRAHIANAIAGDTTENHIEHALTRLAMIKVLQAEATEATGEATND